MFLLFDVHSFNEQLDFTQNMTCPHCGRFGRYEVFITGNRFRLFFIPIFTFGKKYMVHTTCCQSWFNLDPEVGKAIQRNQSTHIAEEDVEWLESSGASSLQCSNCGQAYVEGTNFCSNCGQPLKQLDLKTR